MATASGNLNTTSSIVTSVNERTSNGTGTLSVTSTVSGVSERTVLNSSSPSAGSSSVSGSSAREIREALAVQPSANNVVAGAGDRQSDAEGTPQAQSSTVAGITARQIDVTGIEQVSASTVAGVAEREVKQNTGAVKAGPSSTVNGTLVVIGRNAKPNLTTSSSTVFGQGKVELTARGLETQPITNNLVTGLAERVIDDQGGNSIQPIDFNLIVGVAEREITLQQGIFSGESDSEQSTLNGIAVKKRTFTGSGSFQPIDFNLVAGLGEREVETNTITQALQPTVNNLLSGIAERTVVASGAIADSDNIVAGIAEVEGVGNGALTTGTSTVTASVIIKRVTSGTFKPTDNNLVTGLGEREIDINIQTQFLMSGDASVSGVSEREVVGSGGSQIGASIVTGLSEKTVTATGAVETGVSSVTGLGERTVVSISADLIHPDSRTRPPFNKAERIMVVSGINGFMLSGDVTVTVNAHVGRTTSKDFRPNDENLVVGVAEREITATGISMPDDVSEVTAVTEISKNVLSGIEQTLPSEVTGLSERTVNATGVVSGDSSAVTGLGEREVVLESGIAQVDASVVVSAAERVIPGSGTLQDGSNVVNGLSEVTNTGAGALSQSSDSLVSGSGVRTVHTEPTSILGDTANAPTDADNQVEYVAAFGSRNQYYPRLTNLGVNNYEGIYNVYDIGYVVQESGSNYTRIPSTAYNAYFKFRGSSSIDIIVYNITRNAWYVSTASVSEFLTNSSTFVNASLNQEILTSTSISKPYGSEFDPVAAPDNLVNGVAERIVVDVETTLDTTPSIVNGVAERKSVANGLIVTDITVQVVANIGRITNPELQPGSSRIVGVSENIIIGVDATPATGPSTVAGVAERTVVLESGIEQVPDLSDVVGAGVRTSNLLDGIEQVQDPSDVVGVAERTVVLESGIEQAQESVVAGVAERQIDLDAGIAKVDVSVVAGIAEREITGAGVIVDNSNVVNGVSEREIRTSAALRPTTDNLVTGIAERTINLFQSPKAQPSQVTGLSERQINYFDGTAGQFPGPRPSLVVGLAERVITLDSGMFSADSDLEQSHIIGLGERTINLVQGLIQDSDIEQSHVVGLGYWFPEWKGDGALVTTPSLVSGVAEREIETNEITQTLQPTFNNLLVGVAERIITLDSGILMPDDLSDVAGVAERIIVLEQGIIQDSDLEQSHVVGLGERTINQLDGGDFKPTNNNIVTADAEREIEINEVTQELKPTDNNLVTGLAERIIVLEDGVLSNRFDSDQSHVVALLDSAPVLTIVRKPIEDAVEAGSSEVDTVDADRVIRQIPDGLGPDRLAPSATDANVSYSGNTTLTLSGIVSPVDHNHDYTLLPQGFTVATSGFTNYVVTVDNAYNSYVKHHGPGDYHVVAYSTTANEWVVFESSSNPILWTGGEVLSGSASNSREVATLSDFRNGPFKILEQTSDAVITGVAEREIETNLISQDLVSGPSTIVGAGFRTAVEEETPVQAQPSTLQTPTGSFAERIIEVDIRGQVDTSVISDPSTVSGVAERIIEQNEQNANLQGSSSSTGVAERIIGWQRGDLVVPTRSRVTGVGEREIENNGITQVLSNQFNPAQVDGLAERTINLFQGILSNTSDSEQSHTDNALFPSQGFRTSNLLVGIRSNDSDEQSSVLAGTIDGTGERVIVNAPARLKTTPSLVTGVAERTIELSIFGRPVDNTIISDPSTVTGVAERIIELEKGIGIPSVTPWQEILQGNSFDWSLREGYNNDSDLGWNDGIVNDERNYTGIFNLPFVDKDFYGRTKNVYEIRSPQLTNNGEPDSIGGGFSPDKPSALVNRFVRLDSDQPWTGEFETYYQPDTYYSGWDSTSKIGFAALLNEYDSSGDIKGTPARWNRTPQNWVVYREYRVDGVGAGGFLGRSEVGVEEGLYSVTGRDTYKLTAAGSQYHQDHDLAWSDSGYNDFTRGYRYPRQLYYYPFYNGENQASFYREGPHPGRWTYVFWGPDQWFVFINEEISPSQLAEGFVFDYSKVTVDVGRYYNLFVEYNSPLNVQEAFDSTRHRGFHHFPFEDITSASLTSNPTASLWDDAPQGQYNFIGLPSGVRTGPVLQDSDAQVELTWMPYNEVGQFDGYSPWIRSLASTSPDKTSLVADDSGKIGVWTLDSAGQDPTTLPIWNTLRQSRAEDYSSNIGSQDNWSNGEGWIVGPLARIVGEIQYTDSNPEYAKIYHATDDADIDGVAERIITGGGALVATQPDPSSVQGIAEREIEINEITQELKPTEHNIVTGIAERIITVDEGIHSADDFLEEQSKVTAIVYTNNLEQSRIHTKRKFVLRKERTKTFIVRQTPTG